MSDVADRTTAIAEAVLYAQADVEPVLTHSVDASEVQTIVDKHKLASTWILSTAYALGAIVLPATRNGHRYRCIQAGTSGATEPTWSKRNAGVNSDGTSDPQLLWEEYGPDYSNIYDVRAIIHELWMIKAAKASANMSVKIGSLSFNQQEIYSHCLEMAQKYVPISF